LAAVDPASLPASTRRPVERALASHRQFGELVAAIPDGPLQARLRTLGERLDSGVLAVWRTAQQLRSIDAVTATLDPDRITAELKQARRADAPPEVVTALQERFASTQRLLNSRDELHGRLDVLEARLDTAVARAAELALTSGSAAAAQIDALDRDLGDVVTELDALALATSELA
jgi:hypothetical protein